MQVRHEGNKTLQPPKPTFFSRLYVQLIFLGAIALSFSIFMFTWRTVEEQSQFVFDSISDQASTLARNISLAAGNYILTDDYASLEQLLLQTTSFKDISALRVLDESGYTFSSVIRNSSGIPEPDYQRLKFKIPMEGGEKIVVHDDFLTVLVPIDNGTLGWTRLEYSLASIADIRSNLWLRGLVTAFIVFLISIALLVLLLRKPMSAIGNAAEFARQLYKNTGEVMQVESGTFEIEQLEYSLNDASLRLFEMAKAQKNAEALLRDREQDLAITLNSIADAVITTDAKGLVTRMNPVAEQLTGWLLQEAKGIPLKTIFPIINATTRESIENPAEKVIASGETIYLSNHTTLIAKDGTEYQIADSAAPIRNNEGEIQGMVLIFNDVSEQYQLREAVAKSRRDLQAIMNNTPATIYVKDNEGRYTFVNQQFEKLFNIKREDIIGKTSHDLFPENIADEMQGNDEEVLKTGHAIESEEVIPQNDNLHTYIAIKFPLLNDSGKAYAVCGISTDVTIRKQQEEQLRRSQKMEALGQLTGGIAHDYNNMLGVVLGYAELLEARLEDKPELNNYVKEITHAGMRGVKLTKKLLSFSKYKDLDLKILDLNSVLRDEKHMLEKTLTARIKLIFDLADEIWMVNLDSSELEDAIVNMSINAMHAIEGNGQITIQTRNEILDEAEAESLEVEAGDYVLLSIIDTGSGMDEKTREKIFDPFYTTKGEQGTGLGLSQVYGFIKRCDGAIKVYSEVGIGSWLTLYFPRYRKNDDKDNSQNTDQICLRTEASLSGTETILVVDDEAGLRNLISEVLKKHGYKVYCAENGEQALKLLEQKQIDLLFSDVIMPEMDGYQLAALVQEKYPSVKIQLASGFSDGRHVMTGDETLHKNLLHKPYRSEKLLKIIRGLLD